MSTASTKGGRCPLCGREESEVAHVGNLPLCDALVRQETRVCRGCGVVFERSTPDQVWSALYGDVWQRGALPTAAHRALYADDARRIGPGNGRTAFEIGCGGGFLLDELARAGWKTSGCDPEHAAVELARSKGHAVDARLFEPRAELQADLVVLGDVLEHQADPRAMLRGVRASVAAGGRVYVRVPDLLAIDFESFGDVFGLQHRVWFTPETLRECLASEGFEVEIQGSHGRGQHALARLGTPRPWKRPAGEPERSLALVRRYARSLRARRVEVSDRLAHLAGGEVALYGGGEHAQELLAFSPLGKLATRVVDGNPALCGKPCGPFTIEAPESLRARVPNVVVIASRAYQDEIRAALADLELRGVEIVALYPPRASA
jgi:SAM-dependent methyltransferase